MKYALIIGNTEYNDPKLGKLTTPGKDAEDFANVLRDKNIGAFDDVKVLVNKTESIVREAIDEFFDQKKPDDLLLLYFSGHGIRDEFGSLYLAVKNTNWTRLRATAVKSDFIREVMDQSRSKRQVLILDCCNSGSFPHGTKAITGASIGTSTAFQGYGRIILTASDSTEFAWEGDKIIGETNNSLFTHFLVSGLRGEADLDGDGRITVDELYDYAYDQVKFATPKQNPSKFSSGQQGEIVLCNNIGIKNSKIIPLPSDLIAATENSIPSVREAAVKQLEKLLKGSNLGLALSAQDALQKISEDDDSRVIASLAKEILKSKNFQIEKDIISSLPKATPKAEPQKIPSTSVKKTVSKRKKLLPYLISFLMLSAGAIVIFGVIFVTTYMLRGQPIIPSDSTPTLKLFTPTPPPAKTRTPSFTPTPPATKTRTPSFTLIISTPTFPTNLLDYCDNSDENFCIYSISPQPTYLIVALKYQNIDITPSNIPQLTVGGHNFKCELLAAYPGRIYCTGTSTIGETKAELFYSGDNITYSGLFYVSKYVAPTPTKKKGQGSNYP